MLDISLRTTMVLHGTIWDNLNSFLHAHTFSQTAWNESESESLCRLWYLLRERQRVCGYGPVSPRMYNKITTAKQNDDVYVCVQVGLVKNME